ncbi:MAG: hypothetical protein LH474_04315 [Chamaesiphon sp.]|nr:hypothetical protein [Chamaesiphon sp.]
MKIFPFSDPILLPLSPTIASAIADYLQSIAPKPNINSLQQNWARDIIELQPDLYGHGQFQRSIRQIPTSQYQYVSTIAHQLAAKSALTPLEICQNLDISIPAPTVIEKSVQMELNCWHNESSYIYFQFAPKSIEIWLNYIHDLPIEWIGDTCVSTEAGSLDLAIYAHARCCSRLKLAAAEKLVRVTAEWLLDVECVKNRLTAESNCIFEHPAEQQLIQILMAVLEVIYSDHRQLDYSESETFNGHRKSPNWIKLAIDLAQSWLEFDRRCQILSEIKHQNPRLAIARCGLTAISRRYLQVLLENYLSVKAPVEL